MDSKGAYLVATDAVKTAQLKLPKPYYVDLEAVQTVEDVKKLMCVLVSAMSGGGDPKQVACVYLYEEYAEDIHFLKSKEQKNKEALVELLKKAQRDVIEGKTFTLEEAIDKLKSNRKEIK